jgi:ATP-binding cassette subfamily G (WHITE) protein 2 (SNQ2)
MGVVTDRIVCTQQRVTLAEALVNRAPVIAFDQPTRGLDASTALEFTRSMRTITDYTKTACFISVYQAGNQITECFDKILVIAAGRCIYWGPMKEARPYFENLGFVVSPGANLSDYLTAVTVATERVVADDKKGQVPDTPEEFARAFRESDLSRRMMEEYDALIKDEETRRVRTQDFQENVRIEKAKGSGKKSPYTTTLWTQVLSATRRQYALTWNDKASLAIKQGGCLIQSLILGSLFYMLAGDTTGLFGKAGVLFLILLVNALLGLGEVVNSFKGRTILAKHKSMALYRPSALILAQIMVDLPIVACQVTVFILPIYWMSGLRHTAGAFFTLWVLTYVTTHALLGFFRMVGFGFSSFQASGAVSGLSLGLLIVTMGYLIPSNQFKPWIGWVRWLNPLYYSLESAFINEFQGTTVPCVTPSLIPYGANYPTSGQGVTCVTPGATTGDTSVGGTAYIQSQYGYRTDHLWRNFGIVIVWWIAYVIVTCFAVERLKAAGSVKSVLLFRRPAKNEPNPMAEHKDAEAGEKAGAGNDAAGPRQDSGDMKIDKTETLFSWSGLNYTVPVRGGHRKLLDNIQGFTKPGSLVALMGASGAGKTTLLDVLGARKEDGVIEGEILVDGRPPGPSFQRTCGYVGQMDIHEPTQTIREAFLFSARLRQPADTPDEEIVAYVDKVISVLELEDLANAVIGIPGAGLSIEQRKRTTIGVELVARPKLLFLDEPTSGLDGQSAFQILRFLKKLSAAGQSMLVTVHQPSALLFEQFDQLILLAKGGRTVYNGELGKHASTMKEYFAKNGAKIDDEANAAEEMIDIVSGVRSKGHDWAQVWLDSEEYQEVTKQVQAVNEEAKSKPPSFEEDGLYYAAPLGRQMKLVTQRSWSSIVRTPDYVMGRVGLVVGSGLITGLSFLQMDNNYRSVQNRLLATFQAMFVAPGLFNIIQPRVSSFAFPLGVSTGFS